MNSNARQILSRRKFLESTAIITGGLIFGPSQLFAQSTSPVIMIKNEAARAPIVVQSLRGNINVLSGSGGNISVFSGRDGNLMVDAGIAVSKDKILKALSNIRKVPLKYLISSHWHFDHTGGNEWVHGAGATIVSHIQTKKNLMKTIRVEDWDYTFDPLPAPALPTVTFEQEHTMNFNGSAIHMRKYAPAHTDCDISIHFPDADVLHVADTWWNPYYPFIDHNTGGSLDGMIKACEQNIENTTDKTIIVPGHGAVGNRKQLREFRNMLVEIRHKVSALKKSGRTLAETVAAKPTAAFDKKWGNYVLDGAFFTKLVYHDV